jgi:hypothetical protein
MEKSCKTPARCTRKLKKEKYSRKMRLWASLRVE